MVLEHFKLRVQPFGVTPDPRFLYLSHTHREALASLLYGIHSGRGFTALIAAPGMGKTTLLFRVLSQVATNTRTAFLFQTLCTPQEFLRALLADLEIDDEGCDVGRMHAKLNDYLSRESKNGRQVVAVIDEAQNLDESVLEMLRMLSNFETPEKKLMHIVLSGQPQLAEKLASERLTQLRQRISILSRLAAFTAAETREYIEHRLRVAGAACEKLLFSDKAYAMIAEQSEGIPRNINNLCFNSMSLACALQRPTVDALMVQEAINDLDLRVVASPKPAEIRRQPLTFTEAPQRYTHWRYCLGLAVGALTLVLASVQMLGSNDRIPPQSPASALQQSESDTLAVSPGPALAGSDGNAGEKSRVPALSPQELQRLTRFRIVELPADEQRLEKSQTAPTQRNVPLEPAPQGENP